MNAHDDSAAPSPPVQAPLRWQPTTAPEAWDRLLAAAGGHPLQSRLWGEARRIADGIGHDCLIADNHGTPALARVETRRLPVLGKIAWIPRGPVLAPGSDALASLQAHLRADGYRLLACSGWRALPAGATAAGTTRTIRIDLQQGKDALLAKMDSQWRYGARRALREGVEIVRTVADDDVKTFFGLCASISAAKGFALPGSEALLRTLLQLSDDTAPVQARLFAARYRGELVAGAFVMIAGTHVHYMWGGVDRAHARLRAGEAVQWGVIEWALQQQARFYDLEGIDPVGNPGTYEFKKKMGGEEVVLEPSQRSALDWRGSLVLQALQWRERWQG